MLCSSYNEFRWCTVEIIRFHTKDQQAKFNKLHEHKTQVVCIFCVFSEETKRRYMSGSSLEQTR